VLAGLATQQSADVAHPLLVQREVGTVGIIEVTPDRGLVGGLITNINRMVSRFVVDSSHPVRAYAIGRRGRDFLRRTGVEVAGDEINLGDYPDLSRILTIARLVMDDYAEGTVDQVHLAYTRFVSTVRQEPTMIQLIPVQPPEQAEGAINYEYEPEPGDVLYNLLPRYIEVQIYQALLESKASEQAARLVAMRNATDNANELIGDYTLTLNKVRQAQITTEISEIAAGAEALA
jgi:F-type H+-transporting ATPase subunit gamma